MNLKKLDMKGCRGDARALEGKIWKAVQENRQAHAHKSKSKASQEDVERTVRKLRAEADKIVERIRALEEELRGLRRKADALREQADKLMDPAPRPDDRARTSKGGAAVTQVDVEGNHVLINLGEADGVKPGARFIVHRGDQYVSTIQIRDTRKGESEGFSIKKLQKEAIRIGDRLMKVD